jgi:hypothetical protein
MAELSFISWTKLFGILRDIFVPFYPSYIQSGPSVELQGLSP